MSLQFVFLLYLHVCVSCVCSLCFFFSSRRRHTRCALVTGVQTCALPIYWPLCQHCRWPRCSMNATTPARLSCLSNNISQRCGNGALSTSSLPVISFAHVWRRCAVMWHRLCRGYGKHISWLLNAV